MQDHKSIWDFIIEHPKLSAGVAVLALGVAFSPKASQAATWICIIISFLIFVTLVGGIANKKGWNQIWSGACCLFLAALLFVFGIWLSGWKTENQPPLVYLDPEVATPNADGSFTLRLVNRGPDIEYIGVHFDYFVAQKKDKDITIYRVFQFEEGPAMNAAPLRTNQSRRMNVSFSEYIALVYRGIVLKYAGLVGVRVTATFRRYSDGKNFKKVWAYAALGKLGSDKFDILYGPSTPLGGAGPPEIRDKTLTLSEVMPYMESKERWMDPVVRLSVTPDGKKLAEIR